MYTLPKEIQYCTLSLQYAHVFKIATLHLLELQFSVVFSVNFLFRHSISNTVTIVIVCIIM